ncbi:aldehyde dehydrogenase [Paenactinomyces guangxiensis]|uniref:aldehyde dehydrogenase n=1 Tax=Paenactinomyces guangxiensis TaxID=1490290 RepID=UPI0018DD36E3|nr:aldehyde dehydrogenase [Paenactinomyces guangxiensis]MBH8591412.1 aldehyde dehydrogenase [Paenactinomyces guangxiensis]
MVKLKNRYDLFINGEEQQVSTNKYFQVYNPATGEKITEVAEGGAEDVDSAVNSARQCFESGIWSRMGVSQRAKILQRIGDRLERELETFIYLESLCTGRPIREMAAQLKRLPEWFDYYAGLIRTFEGTVPPFSGNYLNYTKRVPLGVIAIVTPWNHPMLILIKKLVAALAAGNSVVVKPSEFTPITTLMLARIALDEGLPRGAFNVVTGFGPVAGAELCNHPEINKIDLTGGTQTGKKVASMAGSNLAKVSCELGGKASVLFFEDCDLEQAVNGAAFASFIATGQTCVQGARLLVHTSIYNEFAERLVEKAKSIRLGDPLELSTQMGPLISEMQLKKTEDYVQIALNEGATLLYGGTRPKEMPAGYFYQPTIFKDVHNEMRIAQEEVFGPVTCLIPFETEEEAIQLANATDFGLAMGVWTNDVKRAHAVADKLECGIVWINDHHRLDPSSPWGGVKDSGIGRENGVECFRDYTEVKSIIVNYDRQSFDWYEDSDEIKRYS